MVGAQAGPTLDTSLGLAPGKHWQTLSTPRGRVGGHPVRSGWAASWQTHFGKTGATPLSQRTGAGEGGGEGSPHLVFRFLSSRSGTQLLWHDLFPSQS